MSFTWAFGGGDSGKTPRGFGSFGLWLEVSALFVSLRVLPGFGAARTSQGMPVTGTNLTDTKQPYHTRQGAFTASRRTVVAHGGAIISSVQD